jgi:hypothetical protein
LTDSWIITTTFQLTKYIASKGRMTVNAELKWVVNEVVITYCMVLHWRDWKKTIKPEIHSWNFAIVQS